MSGIIGLIRFDDEPIQTDAFIAAVNRLSYLGVDGQRVTTLPQAAFGFQKLTITLRDTQETQPLKHAESGCVVLADARIDNREILARHLQFDHETTATAPDSWYILQAYLKWGDSCAEYLLGDFSFVIWDSANQHILCVRDVAGTRPLYYYHDKHRVFAFSNSLKALLALAEVPENFDYVEVASALYRRRVGAYPMRETVFCDIFQVAPAHCLLVDQNLYREVLYWHADRLGRLHYTDPYAYGEHLRHLLQQAVAARVDTIHPVGTHISGGYDSSGISVLASRLRHQQNKSLIGYTWTSPGLINSDGIPRNENDFIYSIAQVANIACHHEPPTASDILYAWLLDVGTQNSAMVMAERPTQRLAQAQGVRVMLSGWGGDQYVSFRGKNYCTAVLLEGHWKRAFDCLFTQSYLSHENRLRHLWRRGLSYLVPEAIWLRRWRRMFDEEPVFFFADEIFMQRYSPQIRPVTPMRSMPGLRANLRRFFRYGTHLERIEAWYETGADHDIIYHYPLLDKRVLEFSWQLPAYVMRYDGRERFVYRTAMRGILPEQILAGHDKQLMQITENTDAALQEAKRQLTAAVQSDSAMSRPVPWLDIDLLNKYLTETQSLPEIAKKHIVLGHTLQFRTMWYKHLERQQVSMSSPIRE